LAQNEYVQELFSIMQDNGKDTKGLAALIGHVSEMESFVKRAEDKIADMKTQLAEMKEAQGHPVRTALTNAIKTLETKVAEVKERIFELKTAIIDGAKSAVTAFKENGTEALSNAARFFHIKGALKAVEKSVHESATICDKAVADIKQFSGEYHRTGRHLKNMGRILAGKPPIDAAKEAGKLAAVVSAPYKAHKAVLLNIGGLAYAVANKLDRLDAAADVNRARRIREKQPSVLDELDANVKMLAEQNRSRTADRTKVKEAAI
jgi:hypothetical protein